MSEIFLQILDLFEACPELLRNGSVLCGRQCTAMSTFCVNVKQIKMALEESKYERAGYLTVNRRLREMSSWTTK